MIGSYKVARAAPDGYQVGFAVTGTHAQNQSLYKTPLYDAATDFAPVGLISPAPIARRRRALTRLWAARES